MAKTSKGVASKGTVTKGSVPMDDLTLENRKILSHVRQMSMVKHRAFAIEDIGHIGEEARPSKEEVERMLVREKDRFLRMLSPGRVTLWIYNKPTIRGLIYTLLMRYTDRANEFFPPSLDQFLYTDDSTIKEDYFNHDNDALPDQRLCVIKLGTSGRNAYLSEIINEVIMHRMASVSRPRTVFLYEGTRETFRRDYGGVGECTLDRDEYVIDWNDGADTLTNAAMHVSEDVVSRTTRSVTEVTRDLGGATPRNMENAKGVVQDRKPQKPKKVQKKSSGRSSEGCEHSDRSVGYVPSEDGGFF